MTLAFPVPSETGRKNLLEVLIIRTRSCVPLAGGDSVSAQAGPGKSIAG
jgi:hypothetical protein